MEQPKEFIIRIESKDDINGQANNFRVELPPTIIMDPTQKWSVSLTAITFNGKFKQVPPISEDPSVSIKLHPANIVDVDYKVNRLESTYFKQIKSNRDLFNKFKILLRRFSGINTGPNGYTFKPIIALRRNVFTNIISFRAKFPSILKIPFVWSFMLGCTLLPDEHGQVSIPVGPLADTKFSQPMNFNAWIPNVMLIYANFIENSCIGNITAPILRVVPLAETNSNTFYHTYESQMPE